MKIVPNTTIWIWEEPLENVYIRATKVPPTYMYHDFQSDCVDLSICSTHIMFPFGIPWSILARSHLIVSAGIILITSLLFLNRRSELLISFLSTKLLLFKNWYFPFSHFHVFQQWGSSEKCCMSVLFRILLRWFLQQTLSFSFSYLVFCCSFLHRFWSHSFHESHQFQLEYVNRTQYVYHHLSIYYSDLLFRDSIRPRIDRRYLLALSINLS